MQRSVDTVREPARFHELDSMRGIAAPGVVFLHFVDMFFSPELAASRSPLQRDLLYLTMPFYLGRESVLVFFALSGFVLALPYASGRAQPYRVFLLRRIVRIYCPYLAALGLAVAGAAYFHGDLGLGQWSSLTWSAPVSPQLVFQHILFLGNYNWHQYNPAFWSLVVEMQVSLVFPLLAALVVRVPLWNTMLLVIACPVAQRIVSNLMPQAEDPTKAVFYVPLFLCGILLAKHMEAVAQWYRARSSAQRSCFAIATVLLYILGHNFSHVTIGYPAMSLGALGLIVLALHSEWTRRLLQLRVPIFLGRISYSLYLVHIPVLFALTFMLHHRVGRVGMFFIYLAAAILAGTVFNRVVEAPLVRLNRRIGRRSPAPLLTGSAPSPSTV
jgi:peptidoglycan/LPS O-acetylase OafA/YrhL